MIAAHFYHTNLYILLLPALTAIILYDLQSVVMVRSRIDIISFHYLSQRMLESRLMDKKAPVCIVSLFLYLVKHDIGS
jgi:hypothetical protein